MEAMVKLNVKTLNTLTQKTVGLIGANPVYPVYFTTRWGIHTFGMKSPIDVVILDDDNRVVKLTRSLAPNRIFFWNPTYYRVLELPPGTISEKKIHIGTPIAIEE